MITETYDSSSQYLIGNIQNILDGLNNNSITVDDAKKDLIKIKIEQELVMIIKLEDPNSSEIIKYKGLGITIRNLYNSL